MSHLGRAIPAGENNIYPLCLRCQTRGAYSSLWKIVTWKVKTYVSSRPGISDIHDYVEVTISQ